MENKSNKKIRKNKSTVQIQFVYVLCAIITSVFFGLLIARSLTYLPGAADKQPSTTASAEVETKKVYNRSVFEGVKIIGKSYIVYDPVKKEVIAEKSSSEVYPLASITKVLTALLAHTYVQPDEKIKIKVSDLSPEGDSGLRVGDVWSRDELIKYTLTVSSNDGARALARVSGIHLTNNPEDDKGAVESFISRMNSFSKEQGFTTFLFNTESGLDVSSGVYGGEGSASDVAKLFEKVYFEVPDIFENTTRNTTVVTSADGNTIAHNTNTSASSIPGLTISKTGYTDAALGNLGVVVEIGLGHPVVIVVLHSGRESRFGDIDTLYKATVQAMK